MRRHGWREAMQRALYGPAGFYRTQAPAGHFRTSAHVTPAFAGALARLLELLDTALGYPAELDVVDIGAGRGELLVGLAGAVPARLRERLRLTAVELAPPPADLPDWITWAEVPPAGVTGLLLASEWLDNVPLDRAGRDGHGTARYEHTDGTLGDPLSTLDSDWLARWWPLAPGGRAELGQPRDLAWRAAVGTLRAGLALAIDYGHFASDRPPLGTLTGYRHGRQVPPVPDGTCDLTAQVAFDALATPASLITRQRDALAGLGVAGTRPPLALAGTDPAGYLRALADAGAGAELRDPAGLGRHLWLAEPIGAPAAALCQRLRDRYGWHDASHDQ